MGPWWNSVETVSRANMIVLACAAGFGFIAALFVAASWFTGTRIADLQDSELSRYKTEAGIQIAQANELSAKANEGAASANERAAEANQRAAEANRLAESEKLARLRIEEKIRGRRLTAEQKDKLSAVLRPFAPASITIEYPGTSDQEIVDLASDIDAAIRNAGITMSTANRSMMMGTSWRGITILFGDDRAAETEAIANFLIEAGLCKKPVSAEKSPVKSTLAIRVGAKPDNP
jgi:hypothetical protein